MDLQQNDRNPLTWWQRHRSLVRDPPPDGPLQAGTTSWGEESEARRSGSGKPSQTSEVGWEAKGGERRPEAERFVEIVRQFAGLRRVALLGCLSLFGQLPLLLLAEWVAWTSRLCQWFTFFLLRCKCVIMACSLSLSCRWLFYNKKDIRVAWEKIYIPNMFP